MTLDQYRIRCEKAIRANFVSRNKRVFDIPSLQMRVRRGRGGIIRGWIAQLRLARGPLTSERIAKEVRWIAN